MNIFKSFETFLKEPLSILRDNFIQIVSIQTGNIFEKVLAERCLPLNLSANEYSQDQKAFLDKISVIPGIENSEYFSKAIINKADSSSDDLYEKNNEYNQAKKYIAEKLYTEAIPLLKRASANNENAMYDLGICYLKGLGV